MSEGTNPIGGIYFEATKDICINNDMKCCGNCISGLTSKKGVWCKERNAKRHAFNVCNMWRFDNYTYDERKV